MEYGSDTITKDRIIEIAIKQLDAGERFKLPRLEQIQRYEDMYFGKTKRALKNRYNVPLPILSGFVDTLMAKIDDAPVIQFGATEEADIIKAKKVTKAWEVEKTSTRGDWAAVDRMVKKLAIFSGFGVFKYYAHSVPRYESHLDFIDYYDFVGQPKGGFNLENHRFYYQKNIFRSQGEIKKGAEDGLYDRGQVKKLLTHDDTATQAENQDQYTQKINRFTALNLNPDLNEYIGEKIYSLTEGCLEWNGQRWYVFFDRASGIWLRCEPLKDVFKSDLYPAVMWATHPDPYNYLSKSPLDDVYPLADAMKTVFNQALDNMQKRNWNMRAYDSDIFPDPSKLEWAPDGLVRAKAIAKDKNIGQGIYEFKTESNETMVVNLMQYLDDFLGQKSGVTASAQGATDNSAKVGVYYGDLQQVADRLGLYNKNYSECYAKLGYRYLWGLREHMTEPLLVKMIGQSGVEWQELTRKDLKTVDKNHDFDVTVTGGNAEEQVNEIKKQRKEAALEKIITNPNTISIINPKWLAENILRNGDWSDEEIRSAFDANEGDQDSLAEAAQENQELLAGNDVKPNRSATPAHIQKHIDFAIDNDKMPMETYQRIMAHAQAEMPIAQDNMVRRAIAMRQSMGPTAQPQAPIQPGMPAITPPIPGNQPAVAARSQELSNAVSV